MTRVPRNAGELLLKTRHHKCQANEQQQQITHITEKHNGLHPRRLDSHYTARPAYLY